MEHATETPTVRLLHSPGQRGGRLRVVLFVSGGVVLASAAAVASIPRLAPRDSGRAIVVPPATASARHRAATKTADPAPALRSLPTAASAPLCVLEIGDSLGIDLGDQLRTLLDANGMARTVVASLGDSGLSNISYYDWPAHLATLLATVRPQLVVVFIGANDDQGLSLDGAASVPGTPAWVAGYAGRVDEVVSEATNAGARVVWVGMPPMASPDLNAAMQLEDAIYQRETAAAPGALYVPSTPVLGNPSGFYEITGVDATGQPVALRTPDGVHLTPTGAGLLAHTVIDAVDERWHLALEPPPSSRPTTAGSGGTTRPLS